MPNTLTQLNNFSSQSIPFDDERPYSITFDPSSPANVTVSLTEDQPFVSPVGTNITFLQSAPAANLTYNIDLTAFGNLATLTWASPLPTTVSVLNPGSDVYSLTGLFTSDVWELVRNPTISIRDRDTSFSYTANIRYADPANIANVAVKSWTVNATVTATDELGPATTWSYVQNDSGTIVGAPNIIDSPPGTPSYTLTVTPSDISVVNLLQSFGSGGSSTFNSSTKVLTLAGTKDEINSHLNSIKFTPTADTVENITLAYVLTNSPSGVVSTEIQTINALAAAFTVVNSYVEDVPASLEYVVVDQSATATNFVISVAQTSPAPAAYGGYFYLNGSNVGNTVAWSGTKTQVNTANVYYFPPVDWEGNISLSVSQSKTDRGNTIVQASSVSKLLSNTGTNPEITNMIARSYTANTVNNIFSSTTPVLSDGSDVGQTYTIELSSTLGQFGNSSANAVASASYAFTGNTTQCNNEFVNMVFVPGFNNGASGTFNYKQYRAANLQVDTTLTLTGTNAAFAAQTYTFTSNGSFTPTANQVLFGNTSVLLVGGGGGSATDGGGGGGGLVTTANRRRGNVSLSSSSYTVTVGTGGAFRFFTNPSGLSYNQTGNSGGITSLVSSTDSMSAAGGNGGRAVYDLTQPPGSRYTESRGGNSGGVGGTGGDFGAGGGGGGASGNGGNYNGNIGSAAGGSGISSDISGVSLGYGGGGGGGGSSPGTDGGGGSGVGGWPGLDGRGGGGGSSPGDEGRGGSGIVIIKIT